MNRRRIFGVFALLDRSCATEEFFEVLFAGGSLEVLPVVCADHCGLVCRYGLTMARLPGRILAKRLRK